MYETLQIMVYLPYQTAGRISSVNGMGDLFTLWAAGVSAPSLQVITCLSLGQKGTTGNTHLEQTHGGCNLKVT